MERLLSCKCGSEILVTTAQAGRQITCSQCGAAVSVPTLRELANLPRLSKETSPGYANSSSGSVWRWRGPLMAVCAGIFTISLMSALFFFSNGYSVDATQNVDSHITAMRQAVDRSGVGELVQLWDEYSAHSLKFPMPPEYKLANDWAGENMKYGRISLLIGGAMLSSCLLLWRSAKVAQRKKLDAVT